MSNLRVLIVDDDRIDREFLRRTLNKGVPGVHIDEASDYEKGMAFIGTGEHYDCIFVDYHLPGKDGLQFLQALDEYSPHLFSGTIVTTGVGDEEVAVKAMQAGAYDYLVKERITESGLIRALGNACKRAQLAENLYHQQQVQKNFASLAAHELKSPLNMINCFLQTAAKNMTDADAHTQQLAKIALQSADHMTNLVTSLLAYANSGEASEKKMSVSLMDVLESSLDLVQDSIAKSGANVHQKGLPTMSVRPGEMVQLFRNLISNAINYRAEATPEIRVTAKRHEDVWHISVADNGLGVEEDMRERIFEPLQRGHVNEVAGNGLGLAVCAKIVQSHGGRIWCDPNPSGGSIFTFSLPCEEKAARA